MISSCARGRTGSATKNPLRKSPLKPRRRNLPQVEARTCRDDINETDGAHRRCLATGEVRRKSALVRFVVGPEDTLIPDVRERLPGRGLWVSACSDTVESAAKRGLFAKAARRKVTVPARLAKMVESLLGRHALDLLGLAKKAGLVTTGAHRAEAALNDGRAMLLLEASDASPREAARWRSRAKAQGIEVVQCFSAAELGLALGRENVVHAAVSAGPLAQRFLDETVRLGGFRGADTRAEA